MLRQMFGKHKDLALVAGLISILLILFAPIPPFLLDLFIITNFSLALTILLMTLYVERPVGFSTFPALLLVATLFRLALNVAATRLILTQGHAGDVIGSIGAFAVQGSFIVGLVVFFILVVVQYVVVTSGAQRVSEVAARFVLDSVPGQQMSIDADLNMGLIDQNEAKRRRKDLEKEASFYGAMDGASKFVKGDAVAGVIILLIDIIAGWTIGMTQMNLSWQASLETFTLLTIGDGIVTQVPALIISIATGIIVTRSSSDRQLSTEILAQLGSVSKIPLIVLFALVLLLMMPGMPKWPILLLGLIAGAAWFRNRKKGADAKPDAVETFGADAAQSELALSPVEVRLGRELSQAWGAMKPLLAERIANLRQQQERASGFSFPAVTFQDDAQLGHHAYEILLFGARHGAGQLFPSLTLAIHSTEAPASLPGLRVKDPAFGLNAVWIDDAHTQAAEAANCTLADAITILITHLGEILRIEAPLLLTRADAIACLDRVRALQAGLVEELIPAIMSVSDFQRVLQALLAENVSIRNVGLIAEALVDCGRSTKDSTELVELVRQKLCHSICHQLRGPHEHLSVLSLSPRVEAQISESVRRSDGKGAFVLDPKFAEQLLRRLVSQAESMMSERLSPVLLCGPEIRRHLRQFTRRSIPRLAIVSVNEVPPNVDLRSFGVVSFE